jgi:hypothetical protein
MRPDEISIAVNWAEAEGWNPGLADEACFAAADPDGFLIGELDGAPAIKHERLLFIWREQPDELAPLFASHHRNGPPWHPGHRPVFRSSGSCGTSSLRGVIF